MADIERLQVITSNLDDIRNLTNCKICLKPYYEPYILACGHTYCYSCLRSWFGGPEQRRKKKNCPDCRAEVVTQPAPNYLLRDMVHLFIGRAELLPEDESLEEHARGKHDEANQLTNDRNTEGLFRGIFPLRGISQHRPGPIRDLEDMVFRCPRCAFELEEGECGHCGWFPPPDSSYDFSEEDMEDDMYSEDGQSIFTNDDSQPPHAQFFGPQSESENSEDEEGHYGAPHDYGIDLDNYDEEDDFIDNGEVEADLPDEVDYADHLDAGGSITEYTNEDEDEDEEEEEDDNEDVPTNRRRREANLAHHLALGTRLLRPSPSPSQSDGATVYDESEEEDGSAHVTAPARPVARRGRQAVVISDDEGDEDEDDEPPRAANSSRRRRAPDINLQDSEEEDADEATSIELSATDGSDRSESEESEDTAVPPQTRAQRQQRLGDHRSRRSMQAHPAFQPIRTVSPRRRMLEARQHMANAAAAAGRRTARTVSAYVH